jgi:hypothetical protein
MKKAKRTRIFLRTTIFYIKLINSLLAEEKEIKKQRKIQR